MTTTLVILACSKRKNKADGTIPAEHRYTGALFQASLTYARQVLGQADDDILVLSAFYGLIALDMPISNYDFTLPELRKTPNAFQTWQEQVSSVLAKRAPNTLHLLAGKAYRQVLQPYIPGNVQIITSPAGLGYAQQVQFYRTLVQGGSTILR